MKRLRRLRLEEAFETVVRAARFRMPQRLAFEKFHQLMLRLDDDLGQIAIDRLIQQLVELGLTVPQPPADLLFELATGVGKTRLMGALILYLKLSGQSRNFLILAPRVAILDKLQRESDPSHPKYMFVDPKLMGTANLCFRGNLESFTPASEPVNILILSPQTMTGGERRFSRRSDFGPSLEEYLRTTNDLVVFSDESHHIPGIRGDGPGAWREALSGVNPKLHIGMSATQARYPGANIIHEYSLTQCLKEGLFTKAVKVWVEQKPAEIGDEDWDKMTIDFALQRLERKRKSIQIAAELKKFPIIEPILLIAAKDTEHADAIAKWLRDNRSVPDSEVLVCHSKRESLEQDIKQLVNIDQPGNKIRIVVNVFQLSEGWDVTNVYVVAPLRAMATFQNAIQTMGRGLRLPAGQRTGDADLDELDVLCFGKEDFQNILSQAVKTFGDSPEGSAALAVVPKSNGSLSGTERIRRAHVALKRQVEIVVPIVTRQPASPELDFEPEAVLNLARSVSGFDLASSDTESTTEESLRRDFDSVIATACSVVLQELSFLDPVTHQRGVKDLVQRILESLGAKPGSMLATDPIRLGYAVAEQIQSRYLKSLGKYSVTENRNKLSPTAYEWPVPETLKEFPEHVKITEWH